MSSEAATKVRLDTKGFCVFCLKRSEKIEVTAPPPSKTEDDGGDSEESPPEETNKTEEVDATASLRQQLSRVMPRFLGTTFSNLCQQEHSGGEEKDKDDFLNQSFTPVPQIIISYICNDCAYLVGRICHLFHEMKKIEMEMDWKARQLKNIMAFAKRASTRVKLFKDQFSDTGLPEDMQELEKIEKFRKKFLDKCSSNLRKQCPRIVLKRKGDPAHKKNQLLNKIAKDESKKLILHDVEIQTEPVEFEKTSTSKSQSTCTRDLEEAYQGTGNDVEVRWEGDEGGIPSPAASPAPPSPAHSDVIPEDDEEEESQCLIRIRNIESLASPTKSVSPERSTRATRGTLRKLPPVKYNEDDLVEVDDYGNDDQVIPSTSKSKKQRTKSVPDIIASSSVLSNHLPSKPIQIHDKRTKKGTLTEWLQSTFNCDRCNKMFISEATLSVHKTTCGVEEIARTKDSNEDTEDQEEQHDEDSNETPMDIATNDGDSSEEEDPEDPLGEYPPVEMEDDTVESSTEQATTTTRTTCTIRILKKDSTPQSKPIAGSRYCKYCAISLSKNHFGRHRQTMKHKQNKRIHKKAKKMAMSNQNAPATATSASTNSETNGPESANDSTPIPSAIVTVGRDENNVKVVKIIYVGKNGTLDEQNSFEESQQTKDDEQSSQNAASTHTSVTENSVIADVIDISDD